MRLALAASALSLSALGLGFLTQTAQPDTVPASVPAPAPVASDAAAKHLKRTACLKEAKAKKLIGAEKSAFLKSCIEAPQQPLSASRRILPERP